MKEWSFSQNWYQFLIMAVVCYLIGCFNFAKTLSHALSIKTSRKSAAEIPGR